MQNSTTVTPFDDKVETTVLGVVYLLLAIYVIVINMVEIVIITRIKTTSSTIFIASLALTDFMTGVTAILPSSISFLLNSKHFFLGSALCDITGVIANTSLFTSLLTVLCISLNRYIALVLPLYYSKISTTQMSFSVTAGIWLVSLLRSLSPYYKGHRYLYVEQLGLCNYFTSVLFGDQEIYYYALLQVAPFSICFVLLICCPLHMTLLLSRRSRDGSTIRSLVHQRSENFSDSPIYASSNLNSMCSNSKGRSQRKAKSRGRIKLKARQVEQDATITTLLVILIFVVCYAINYFFICYYFSYLAMGHSWPFEIQDKSYEVLETMWMLMMNLNSMFNPIIYLFRNTSFQNEMVRMKRNFERLFRCFSETSEGSTHIIGIRQGQRGPGSYCSK